MSMVVIGATFSDIKGFPLSSTFIPRGRNAGRVEFVHGGVCCNVVEDLSRLGEHPVFLSLVDDTSTGTDIIRHLSEHHVDTTFIRAVPDGIGIWLAVFDEKGDVYASVSKRPDLSMLIRTLDEEGDRIFSTADSILLEIDMDKEIVRRCFSYAEKYHVPIYTAVSNISIAIEKWDYIRRTDCFFCNLSEAELLFHEPLANMNNSELITRLHDLLLDANMNSMVVTLGEKGSVYISKDGTQGHCPAIPVNVTDTTGAGDAFFAGASAALTHGRGLPEACALGTRMSALVLQTTFSTCQESLEY